MQPLRILRHPTTWGAAALALATVVALVAAWLYISPPGQQTITFYTVDAASVRAGDQVRIAGVPVGKVQDLTLEPDRVRVRARVDKTAFVGFQSQVSVRMLTVVGGYYVAIDSLGNTPLGSTPIPIERVKMPYNLMQTLTDSRKLVNRLDAQPLQESLTQLQQGFGGDNVQTLSSIIDAGNSLMSTLEQQRGQVSAMLNFSDEYLRATNNFKDQFTEILRKMSIMLQVLTIYGESFGNGLEAFTGMLTALTPVSYFYDNHRAKFLEKVRVWMEKARMYAETNGLQIRAFRAMRNKFQRLLDATNAPPELLATDICIPVPGTPC